MTKRNEPVDGETFKRSADKRSWQTSGTRKSRTMANACSIMKPWQVFALSISLCAMFSFSPLTLARSRCVSSENGEWKMKCAVLISLQLRTKTWNTHDFSFKNSPRVNSDNRRVLFLGRTRIGLCVGTEIFLNGFCLTTTPSFSLSVASMSSELLLKILLGSFSFSLLLVSFC